MSARHRSRQRALQLLFAVDLRKQAAQDAIDQFYESLSITDDPDEPLVGRDPFMELLVKGTADHSAELNKLIEEHAQNWRIERMSVVDRNILRLAVHEMLLAQTPPAVIIDEALELARQFSGDESVPFINGVLDAIRKRERNDPAGTA